MSFSYTLLSPTPLPYYLDTYIVIRACVGFGTCINKYRLVKCPDEHIDTYSGTKLYPYSVCDHGSLNIIMENNEATSKNVIHF